MRKYARADHQRVYDTLRAIALDCSSEMYFKRLPRTGAIHRVAFWLGFDGAARPPYLPGRSISAVAYQAGKDFAREVLRSGRLVSTSETASSSST